MTEKVTLIAPTARQGAAAAAAAVASPKASRSAHSDEDDMDRAVQTFVDHGRIVAHEMANGDSQAQRRLLYVQGETLMKAGMRLMTESGEA